MFHPTYFLAGTADPDFDVVGGDRCRRLPDATLSACLWKIHRQTGIGIQFRLDGFQHFRRLFLGIHDQPDHVLPAGHDAPERSQLGFIGRFGFAARCHMDFASISIAINHFRQSVENELLKLREIRSRHIVWKIGLAKKTVIVPCPFTALSAFFRIDTKGFAFGFDLDADCLTELGQLGLKFLPASNFLNVVHSVSLRWHRSHPDANAEPSTHPDRLPANDRPRSSGYRVRPTVRNIPD